MKAISVLIILFSPASVLLFYNKINSYSVGNEFQCTRFFTCVSCTRSTACSMNSYLFKNCNLAIEILQAIETFL